MLIFVALVASTAAMSLAGPLDIEAYEDFVIPKHLKDRRELKLDRLDKVIRSVASSYRTFEYYQEHRDKVEKHTLEDFAVSATSHGDGSIRKNLQELHSLVSPRGGVLGGGGIFTLLANSIDKVQIL